MKLVVAYMICLSPVPPGCFTADHNAMLANPICVAASKDCTIYEDVIEGTDFQDCVAWKEVRLALARAEHGYARGSYPTCSTAPERTGEGG